MEPATRAVDVLVVVVVVAIGLVVRFVFDAVDDEAEWETV